MKQEPGGSPTKKPKTNLPPFGPTKHLRGGLLENTKILNDVYFKIVLEILKF